MALTNDDLKAIADLLQPLKTDVQELKADVQGLKTDERELKNHTQELDRRITNIGLTLENETNRNIQLLAENHITLIDRLNQSIKVADKTLMYEVQMTSLKLRIENLEKEVAGIKNNIA